jgi:hypothetical protein
LYVRTSSDTRHIFVFFGIPANPVASIFEISNDQISISVVRAFTLERCYYTRKESEAAGVSLWQVPRDSRKKPHHEDSQKILIRVKKHKNKKNTGTVVPSKKTRKGTLPDRG